jgi:hypothetical protein
MMISTDKCPTCGTRKNPVQPEPINNRQDIFFVCGGAVTYDLDNPSKFDETGDCENKIDWTHILIEYGGEFDENAKLVDERFFGWLEYDFYKKIHVSDWVRENPEKSYLDKDVLDEYFNNKELYVKKFRDEKGNIRVQEEDISTPMLISGPNSVVTKEYTGDVWLGSLTMRNIYTFNQGGFEKTIYKVLISDEPTRIGGYVIESNQIGGGDDSVDFYDREIIEIIIKNEIR